MVVIDAIGSESNFSDSQRTSGVLRDVRSTILIIH